MLAKSIVVLAALAAVVVAQPHGAQGSRHHAIAAAHSERAPVADAQVKPAVQRMRKRKTCRPHTSHASAPASTAAVTSSSAAEEPSAVVGNAGSKPTLSSAPAVAPTSAEPKPTTSSKAAEPEPTTSSKAAEPKPTTSSKAPEPTTSSKAAEPAPTTSSKAQEPKPTTSSKAPEPKPTTSKAAEPEPTTSSKAPEPKPTTSSKSPEPTTSKAADPKPTSGSGPSFLYGKQTGQGTFYNTGLVACGQTYKDTDKIAAVSHLLFDAYPGAGANPNNNPICGKKVRATYQGKSVDVAIVDRCTGCAITDLDFTPSAFDMIADESLGRLSGVTWEWL